MGWIMGDRLFLVDGHSGFGVFLGWEGSNGRLQPSPTLALCFETLAVTMERVGVSLSGAKVRREDELGDEIVIVSAPLAAGADRETLQALKDEGEI